MVEPLTDVVEEWGAMVDSMTRFRDLVADDGAAVDQGGQLIAISPRAGWETGRR